MTKTITLNDLPTMSVGKIMTLRPLQLSKLLKDAEEQAAQAQAVKNWLERIVNLNNKPTQINNKNEE